MIRPETVTPPLSPEYVTYFRLSRYRQACFACLDTDPEAFAELIAAQKEIYEELRTIRNRSKTPMYLCSGFSPSVINRAAEIERNLFGGPVDSIDRKTFRHLHHTKADMRCKLLSHPEVTLHPHCFRIHSQK